MVSVALGSIAHARTADQLESAMALWQQAIDAIDDEERVRAIELYGGGFWGDLRASEPALRQAGVAVRIVSAGLGLLCPDDRVPNYNATFASGRRNSIGGARGAVERNREWWRLLGQWKRGWIGPRSLVATVRHYPEAAHVIALPLDYIDSVLDDVNQVIKDEACVKRTVVLATPYSSFGRRIPGSVEISGDLYGALGGTRGTVLARAALHLAAKLKFAVTDRTAVAAVLAPLCAKAKPLPVRTAQTDAEITKFIRPALQKEPGVSHSNLLAKYRSNGYACEYSRFRRLFIATKAAL